MITKIIAGLGPGTAQVLRRLGLMTVAFGIAKVVMMLANIIVARKLGEEQFGHGNLIVVGAMTIGTLMQAGLPQAMNVYCARSGRPVQSEISFGLMLMGIFSFFCACVVLIFPNWTARTLRLDLAELWTVLILGGLFASYTLSSSIIQGLHLARRRAISELTMNAVAAVSMVAMLPQFGPWAIPYAMLAGYLAGTIFLAPAVLSHANYKDWIPTPPIGRQILSYGGFSLLCSVGFLFTYMFQNIQIDRLLDRSDVGRYRIIILVTTGTAFTFSSITATILIAKSAAIKSRLPVYWRMLKTWLLVFAPGTLAFIAIQYPVMWVVNFPTSLHVALAFSVASMLIMVQTSLGQVMAAHGVHGAAVGVGLSLILAVLTYWSTELLIPHLGVAGCGWALVIGYGVCALVQTLLAPWYFSLPTGEGIQSEDFSSKIERD